MLAKIFEKAISLIHFFWRGGFGLFVVAQFVIPAKAGIQIFPFYSAMDAHFRGHDNFLFKLSQYRAFLFLDSLALSS